MPTSAPNSSSSSDLVVHGEHLAISSNQQTSLIKTYLQDMVMHHFIAIGRAAAEAMSSLKLKTATDACRASVVLTSRVTASASSLCTPISTTSTTSRRSCVIISVYIVFRGCLLIYNDTRFRWWAISFSCWPYLFLSMFYIMSSYIGVDNGVYLNLNLRGSFLSLELNDLIFITIV